MCLRSWQDEQKCLSYKNVFTDVLNVNWLSVLKPELYCLGLSGSLFVLGPESGPKTNRDPDSKVQASPKSILGLGTCSLAFITAFIFAT